MHLKKVREKLIFLDWKFLNVIKCIIFSFMLIVPYILLKKHLPASKWHIGIQAETIFPEYKSSDIVAVPWWNSACLSAMFTIKHHTSEYRM